MNELTPGMRVMWLYWPPDARYRMCKHVDAVVVKVTAKRVTVKAWDKRERVYIRHVSPDRLIPEGSPGFDWFGRDSVYRDGFYPARGDAPEYRSSTA